MTMALDSSIIIDVERDNKITIQKLKELKNFELGRASISFMTYLELLNGIQKQSEERKQKSKVILESFHFLTPTKSTAQLLTYLNQKYHNKGSRVEFADLFIAAQAIEHYLVLVSKDKK